MKKHLFLTALGMTATILTATAQEAPAGYQDINPLRTCANTYIETARDTVKVGFDPTKAYVGILADGDYTVTPDDAWLSAEKHANGLAISVGYSYLVDKRVGSFTLTTADGSYSRKLYVEQAANNSASQVKNTSAFKALVKQYFKDDLCTQLADGMTLESAATIDDPYLRQLVSYMASGDYSTRYRVGEFEPYETISTVRERLKNSNPYCNYENPTGIYFEKGQTLAIFVEGATSVKPTLKIYCFGEGDDFQQNSTYALNNGVNVITTRNRGNGYLMYYSDSYASLPNVRVHFAMATENGYFDLQRGDTNDDWIELLAGATSDIIDIRTPRMQAAMPLKTLRSVCPKKGRELAQIYDDIIYREREVMGLVQGIPGFTPEPKNRQFARPASSGMFASGEGANAAFGSLGEWCNPDNFGYWGLGHELGHNNQIPNGFKWPGLGETTNNIYASWVEHKLGTGYHRLEDEVTGVDAYKGMRGGRFEAYLEEGVRKGVSWQLQDGPDYHGAEPTADGSRNYDHFVKVIPLYQLNLWTQDCGKSPNAYGKVIQGYRTLTNNPSDSGKQQINFMRNFCDSTQIDFLDFFERAGLLRPIDRMIEDYSKGRLTITQKMIDDLRAYIDAKGYPKAPTGLNYLNAYNLASFRDETPLVATSALNAGCTKSGNFVTVTHIKWPGAVGFETYDADGNCTAITMYGLGDTQKKADKTKVLYPTGSKYIMAVGYDGTKVKIYEK